MTLTLVVSSGAFSTATGLMPLGMLIHRLIVTRSHTFAWVKMSSAMNRSASARVAYTMKHEPIMNLNVKVGGFSPASQGAKGGACVHV